jgi:hypothetical protein
MKPRLRLDIWKKAAPEERIIEIIFNKKYQKNRQAKLQTASPTPTILHVCTESREVGLKIYSKLVINDRFMRTFICWDTDTILMDPETERRLLDKKELFNAENSEFRQNCKNVAIMGLDVEYYVKMLILKKQAFSQLKKLIAVSGHGKREESAKFPQFGDATVQDLVCPAHGKGCASSVYRTKDAITKLAAYSKEIECLFKTLL